MLRRIFATSKKEFYQIVRDRKLLYVIFIFPILLLILFGYAINFDVHHIKLAVYDQDNSDLTRSYIKSLTETEYFDLVTYVKKDSEINYLLDNKIVQCVVVFPRDFSNKLFSKENVKVQYLIDGIDGNAATIIYNYVSIATRNFSQKLIMDISARNGLKNFVPVEIRPVFWFNPDLSTTRFLVPGLIGFILVITAVVSVALSIVKEKERGTIEQINVSPLNSIEFILGKTVPYAIISLIVAILILVAGYILFGVEIKGSYFLLLITTLIFILASLNLGFFISAISETQQIAFQIASIASLLPSLLLSGFVFPIESMPTVIQILSNITPTKFFLVIIRSICLKGAGLSAFYDQVIYLLIFATVFGLLATIINKKKRFI